jgi:sugar (pentulose or hexulose) kinase
MRQVLADLAERPVAVPKGDRRVAGACVQAAAALHGAPPEEIAAGWSLHDARDVEPDPRVDGEEIRAVWRDAAR